MDQKSNSHISECVKKRKKQSRLNRGVRVLAGLVAIFTLYTLMLPAHTLESTPVCGITEHIHTEACYRQTGGSRTLVCTPESLQLHQHGESCYDADGNLVCGMADYVLHTHQPDCYDSEGRLICPLPEISGEPHEHTESCYSVTPGRLICNLEEDENHTHTEACYEQVRTLVCAKPAVSEHVHTGPCFLETAPVKELICGMEEHTHSGGCYADGGETSAGGEPSEPAESPSAPEELSAVPVQPAEKQGSAAWAELVPAGEQPAVLAGGQSRNPDRSRIQMENMIKKIEVTYIPKDTGKETPLTDDTVLSADDQIKCRIDYQIPGNVLTESGKTITYQAPGGLNLVAVEQGYVENHLGQKVGTYQIDTDGRIAITFYDSYVEQNKSGSPIDGSIRFDSSINPEELGPDGTLDLDFSSDCVIHIKVTDGTEKKGDIHLLKYAEKQADGRIKYTLYVSTIEGTFGPVTVRDTMTGTVYDGGLKIEDSDGSRLTADPEPVMGAGSFEFQLPPLAVGDRYIIYYYGKPDPANVVAKVSNTAEAGSTDSIGGPISDVAASDTTLDVLAKEGVYDEEAKTITWTVTVNSARLDISGWILGDKIEKPGSGSRPEAYTGSATLTDSQGNSRTITLPYTFPPESTDTYRITYTTPAPFYTPGTNLYRNHVTLHKGTEEQASGSADVEIGEYHVLSKKAGTPVVQGETVTIPWTVTLDFTGIGIDDIFDATVSVFDHLVPMGADHYFTGAQTEALRKAGTAAFREAGIDVTENDWQRQLSSGVFHWYDIAKDPDDRYLGFWLDIDREKLKFATKPVTFSYETTGTRTAADRLSKFKNEIAVNHDFSHDIATVVPEDFVLYKEDKTKPGGMDSQHTMAELTDGSLEWRFFAYIPPSMRGGNITITEDLPDHVEFSDLSVAAGPFSDQYCSWIPGSITEIGSRIQLGWTHPESGVEYKIDVFRESEKRIVIELPAALNEIVGDDYYRFWIRVRIKDEALPWITDGDTCLVSFKNTVTATAPGLDQSASQTQTVTKNKYENVISKTGAQNSSNTVSYTIAINPDGVDLLEGKDTLTVVDTMEYRDSPVFGANLVPGSVNVYTMKQDGTRGEKVEAPYEYKNRLENSKRIHVLRLTIPDGQPLLVSYSYLFHGKLNETESVSNKAMLEGLVSPENNTGERIDVVIKDSAAVAVVRGITLLKVEQGNNDHALSGAEFTLSCWDGKQFNRVSDLDGRDVFVTRTDGTITIRTDRFRELKYNTAYCFEEIKAPDGYIRAEKPYYFYVRHEDTVRHPENLPENFFTEFEGNILNDGSLIYMDNRKNSTSIRLVKEWIDVDGTVKPEIGRPIEVTLYRQAAGGKKEPYRTYTLTAENNWTLTVTDLPACATGEDGTGKGDYLYTVEEASCPLFRTSYVNNSGITSGEIRIVNRKESTYRLPATGGSGTAPFCLAGVGIMGLSLLLLKKKRERDS